MRSELTHGGSFMTLVARCVLSFGKKTIVLIFLHFSVSKVQIFLEHVMKINCVLVLRRIFLYSIYKIIFCSLQCEMFYVLCHRFEVLAIWLAECTQVLQRHIQWFTTQHRYSKSCSGFRDYLERRYMDKCLFFIVTMDYIQR